MYLKVQGNQKVPEGPKCPKSTSMSNVLKMYLMVQGFQKLPKDPRYPKISKGPRYTKGT